LCLGPVRARRCLLQRGFELAHGLPFVAADDAIHALLNAHTLQEAQALQVQLGLLRRAGGHFDGRTLILDPHRIRSYSKRHMRRRKEKDTERAVKTAQVFFCLDADTQAPLGFTMASPARSATPATPALLELAQAILTPHERPLVLLDCEHYSAELFRYVRHASAFDVLAPLPHTKALQSRMAHLAPSVFTPRWAGFATATLPYHFDAYPDDTFHMLVQRCGERPEDYRFKGFLGTRPDDEVYALTQAYPQRWHIEEFFNTHQALGWNRAGTMNLNIRYAHMSLALVAQAALHGLRHRLGPPWKNAEAGCLARDLLTALDGDIRVVRGDTILVTVYNAPAADRLRPHYEHLPQILAREDVDPRVPWLYGYKLDCRFT